MARVFGPDAFTVGADQNIDTYPTGSTDYAYSEGSGTNLTVNAANDRIQLPNGAVNAAARCIDAAAPTVNQEARANINTSGSDSGFLAARMQTNASYYCTYLDAALVNECAVYKVVNSTFTLLTDADRGLGSGARATTLRATGIGTVNLQATFAGTAPLTTTDSSSPYNSGPPGLGGFNATANAAWIDNFEIDDTQTSIPRFGPIQPQRTMLCR